MPDWAIWFIIGAVLLGGELAITAFILGPLGLAAFGAGICAALGGGVDVQIVTFIVLSILSLLFIRPVAKRHLKTTPPLPQRTGASALVGQEALVLERVDRDRGQVKIGGDVWSARSTHNQDMFESGDRVVVDSVDRTIVRVSAAPVDDETTATSGSAI